MHAAGQGIQRRHHCGTKHFNDGDVEQYLDDTSNPRAPKRGGGNGRRPGQGLNSRKGGCSPNLPTQAGRRSWRRRCTRRSITPIKAFSRSCISPFTPPYLLKNFRISSPLKAESSFNIVISSIFSLPNSSQIIPLGLPFAACTLMSFVGVAIMSNVRS